MTFQAMKRLAKWLFKGWWDDAGDLDAMRRDFLREVVTNSVFTTDDKIALIAEMVYGPEEGGKADE